MCVTFMFCFQLSQPPFEFFLSPDSSLYNKCSCNELPKNLHCISLRGTCTFLISSFWFFSEKTHNPTQPRLPAKSPNITAFPQSPSAPHFTFGCCHAASFCTQMRDYQVLPSLLPHIFHPFSWQAVLYSGPHILW